MLPYDSAVLSYMYMSAISYHTSATHIGDIAGDGIQMAVIIDAEKPSSAIDLLAKCAETSPRSGK